MWNAIFNPQVTATLWKISAVGFGILLLAFLVIRILLAIKRKRSY